MKKVISLIIVFLFTIFVGCASESKTMAIELMGAGDRMHDSFTFANEGVEINGDNNTYTIMGSVEKLANEKVKKEFDIAEEVTHVIAIKLTAVEDSVVKEEVEITVDGVRSYDAEHLNGANYTFIILEAVPDDSISINVKWNKNADEKHYIINFDKNLILK